MLTYISVLSSYLQTLARDEEGASAIEYGLILGLIAAALILVLFTMRGDLLTVFTNAGDGLSDMAGGGGG
jgi:pilus assembly protein Flp/PilA